MVRYEKSFKLFSLISFFFRKSAGLHNTDGLYISLWSPLTKFLLEVVPSSWNHVSCLDVLDQESSQRPTLVVPLPDAAMYVCNICMCLCFHRLEGLYDLGMRNANIFWNA